MIKRREQTRITISKSEVLVIRSSERLPSLWCASCREQSRIVSLEEAVEIASVSALAISQEVEAGGLHLIERDNQPPSICLNSLLASKLT